MCRLTGFSVSLSCIFGDPFIDYQSPSHTSRQGPGVTSCVCGHNHRRRGLCCGHWCLRRRLECHPRVFSGHACKQWRGICGDPASHTHTRELGGRDTVQVHHNAGGRGRKWCLGGGQPCLHRAIRQRDKHPGAALASGATQRVWSHSIAHRPFLCKPGQRLRNTGHWHHSLGHR